MRVVVIVLVEVVSVCHCFLCFAKIDYEGGSLFVDVVVVGEGMV